MGSGHTLSQAFYSHWAFAPHLLLKRVGIRTFWLCNTLLTLIAVVALLLCSSADNSILLGDRGFGFLQHPAIFGWFLIQLSVPIALQRTLGKAVRAQRYYQRLAKGGQNIEFRERAYEPLLLFIGFRSERSRLLFSLLFTVGFGGFAWNTYHNIFSSDLDTSTFWDSINFTWGYFGTRLYKFYVEALLLPSVIHIFAGIVWFHISYLNFLVEQKKVRILPFSPDRAGGMTFVADIILSPAITALLVSGVAFLGAVYAHRSFDITVAFGTIVEVSVLTVFYVLPTAFIRGVIKKLISAELSEIYECQQRYYDALLRTSLGGKLLKEAHEYSQYFQDIAERIRRIPKWPHLAKVFGAFGISITPAIAVSSLGLVSQWAEFLLGRS